jgi:ferredoxin-NADP reductase
VERLDGGEVSTFLHDVVVVGDEIEVRGPIGGGFVGGATHRCYSSAAARGGGTLMAMLRLARRTGRAGLVRVVVSVRSPDDLYYADELQGPEATIVNSRRAPADADRPAGRIRPADLEPAIVADATAYVCGSAGFADAASHLLVDLDVPVERIRVERFGPTG